MVNAGFGVHLLKTFPKCSPSTPQEPVLFAGKYSSLMMSGCLPGHQSGCLDTRWTARSDALQCGDYQRYLDKVGYCQHAVTCLMWRVCVRALKFIKEPLRERRARP